MVRRAFALILASALAVALGACGSADREPKRTVDARNEAIRFFGPGTPFVALIDPAAGEGADPGQVMDDLAGVPAVAVFARENLGFASEQGLGLDDLTPLLGKTDASLELATTQVAVGIAPDGIPTEDALIVVVTDRPRLTATRIDHASAAAGMKRAGALDGAHLYEGSSAALAVRDGVVLLAQRIKGIRDALRVRDSDPDLQLDDGQVVSVLEKLPETAPLQAYADVGALARIDPALAGLAGGPRGWVSSLAEAGLSVTPGEPSQVELATAIDGSVRDEVPLEERPLEIALGRRTLARALVDGGAAAGDFRDALLALAPGELTVSATSDELRLLLRTSP